MKCKTHPSMDMLVTTNVWRSLGSHYGATGLKHINLRNKIYTQVVAFSNITFACVKENQLDAQLILGTFRQPPHVSDVSRPIIMRYNRYTMVVPPDDGFIYARNM